MKKMMEELQRIDQADYIKIHDQGAILILDNIRSAHNVGSIFRTSDAFGISEIYLCGITCDIQNREVQKTALGAELAIPSFHFDSTLEAVNHLKENYTIVALEQTHGSIMLDAFPFDHTKKYAFILGNEVEGVDASVLEACHYTIEIPQVGSKHSINVSNASSILLWEYYKSMQTN